ncbi:hypothetical protein AB0D46_27360 [Streptomyces sp. NPDC048383]|uniref:hypothetical protein n=1 Tax=Streptomyces sp. NPDC048383 TaxID=3155386 RepID=UPI003443C9F1
MPQTSGRTVSVHLTHGGEYFGLLGPYAVDEGWWSSTAPVVERVSGELGVPVVVLRLAYAPNDGSDGHGGHVVYHVEALERPARAVPRQVAPDVAALLGPAERRAGWATAVGLREALDWAEDALAGAGRPAVGRPEQVRTWNLSGLFRFRTSDGGEAWLKVINPAFNAREGQVIELLGSVDPTLVPTVLDSEPAYGRLLLDHVAGEDLWCPSADDVRQFLDEERWAQVAEVWARAWRESVPGSAPERSLTLVEPLFHLAHAVRYQEFLDHIETSERSYHEGDPVTEIRKALACASRERVG